MAASIVKALGDHGLLDPMILAVLGEAQLRRMVEQAAGEEPDPEAVDAATLEVKTLQGQLKALGTAEIRVQAQEWRANQYRDNHPDNLKRAAPTLHEAQAAFSSHKTSKVMSESWADSSRGNRVLAVDRCKTDEVARNKLAEKALYLLLQTDLVADDVECDDKWKATMLTRFRRGLRTRTLRLRLQSATRAVRWTQAALHGKWFSKVEEVEAYLSDLSSCKGSGSRLLSGPSTASCTWKPPPEGSNPKC